MIKYQISEVYSTADMKMESNRQNDIYKMADHSDSESSSSDCKSFCHKKGSLIQVMSINGDDIQEDIYQYYLIDDAKNERLRSSSNHSRKSSFSQKFIDEDSSLMNRSSNNRLLGNVGICDDSNDQNCLGLDYSCYNSPLEMCLLDKCCLNCIKKIQQLKSSSKNQKKIPQKNCTCSYIIKANGDKQLNCHCQGKLNSMTLQPERIKKTKLKVSDSHHIATTTCSCKKSHCLKKYCHCFASGGKCSPQCECEDCSNYDQNNKKFEMIQEKQKDILIKQQNQQIDIDQYFEDDHYEDRMVPQSMQFDHPDLRLVYHN